MSSFVIVNLNLLDEESFTKYSTSAAPTVAKYGGEFVAKGSPMFLTGNGEYEKTAIIQFPDREAAKNWYNSDEYQQLIPIRNRAMDSVFQLV